MVHRHAGTRLGHGREGGLAIHGDVDGPGGGCAKWGVSDRKRQMRCELAYVWSLKKTNKQKHTHRHRAFRWWPDGRAVKALGGQGRDRDVQMGRYETVPGMRIWPRECSRQHAVSCVVPGGDETTQGDPFLNDTNVQYATQLELIQSNTEC